MTLKELYKEWSEAKYKKISKATENNYRAAWNYINEYENNTFKDLRTAHLQKLIDKNKLSLSSLKKIKTVLVMLYKYALQNDIVNKNYAEFIALSKEEKKEKNIFTDTEIKKLFKAKLPWADTILIMIYTGLRISELLALTKFNVDIEKGFITGGIKTDAGKNRLIPIHPKILPFIKRWHETEGEALISREGKKLRTEYYRKKLYYPVLDKLGIEKRTPHSCRHTFASLMSRAGANPLHIQKIMGHTDYAFTANTYTHPEYDELKRAVAKI
jgi:integrase